jgi:hypothetical protein
LRPEIIFLPNLFVGPSRPVTVRVRSSKGLQDRVTKEFLSLIVIDSRARVTLGTYDCGSLGCLGLRFEHFYVECTISNKSEGCCN